MSDLIHQIKKEHAKAFTHSGKFHADDVFSSALLLYLNPEISIIRGNQVPEDFDGIVFDIGRGKYDHHQKDSRVRKNQVPYAAFGLLWEELGKEILGDEIAEKFDESFVQPLDINDNTGEKNELASLIGNFNPPWDSKSSSDVAFFQAVQVAGMILENKFERYRGNERADRQVDEVLKAHEQKNASGELSAEEQKILILPEFIPCQKRLSETDIAFVIFPSNRGGYCIQPQKKEYSLNYKCGFPSHWLGLEGESLIQATGLNEACFCHKSGFLMTVGTVAEAVKACQISLESFCEEPVVINLGAGLLAEKLLKKLPDLKDAKIITLPFPELPELETEGIYGEISMEKPQWKACIKEQVNNILKYKPEAVCVGDSLFFAYPVVHALRKRHVPVFTIVEKSGEKLLVRIPSGS